MEQYDVLVIGSDVTSLVAALFLARKMRNVSVLLDEKNDDQPIDIIHITDPENNKFRFEYDREAYFCGLDSTGLGFHYLKNIGLDKDIKGTKLDFDTIVKDDALFRDRANDFDRFRVYLVRYYPRQRDAIHRFFKDLERHYQNYVIQQQNMLKNTSYTLSSLMIEWGDYSLQGLLEKYFSDPQIIDEFLMNHQVNGLNPTEINSYHFFSQYFLELEEGLYLLHTTTDKIRQNLLDKLAIINPKIAQKRRVKEYVYDESGKITHVVDTANRKIYAKHFVVKTNPETFYQTHFSSFTREIELIHQYYPNLASQKRVNTLYLALNQKPQVAGIEGLTYYFSNPDDSVPHITKLFHYSQFDPDSVPSKSGAICVDYVYSEDQPVHQDELLKQLFAIFPKLKKSIVGFRMGTPRQYLAIVSQEEVRKGLSINEQIEIESSEHLLFFDNLHMIGRWLRPEAGLYGSFHSGILLGDKIEESLYYGEDDDSFYYLTNDEIMMMMRHNYGKKTLGPLETHINFYIGKSSYFVRAKGKNVTIHQGEHLNPDLAIYTTNDKFSNLLLKKITFDEVLQSGGLKYTGKMDLLYEVVSAFELDDYQEQELKFQPKFSSKFLGVKFLFAYLLIFSFVAFLHNYIDMIWLAPFALALHIVLGLLRLRIFRTLTWFEYAWGILYLASLFLAIFWPAYNSWRNDDVLLALMGGMFFGTWLINKPIVYDFHRYDFRNDYANTALFKVINNGLTFVWALIFLGILAGTYIAGQRYVSVLYNLVFLGFFLTYLYPIIYVSTNIKK